MFVGEVGYENRVARIRQDHFNNIEFKIGEPSALYSNNRLMKACNQNL